MITQIRIPIIHCTEGIYLRWWYNGFHYFNFRNGHEVQMTTESMDIQVTRVFSVISKIERPTKLKSKYSYQIEISNILAAMIDGFNGLLMAEKVEQYEDSKWYEVDITRNEHLIKEESAPGYSLTFEITRKELPNTPAVFQKSQYLFIGDTLADIDDDEVIPINKQVNDIAEMQDRQSDFTAGFKIRKTRAMRAKFELSGEVGANTTFPYEKQNIRLIQEGIEIISVGYMILDKTDDQYYYVSVYSGNLNFFKEIEGKKISDLSLSSCAHTWNKATQVVSHDGLHDYVYPLCEPSDDGGIAPATDTGSSVEIYGGYIWPFIKLKTIWDEIISNAGFKPSGNIQTNTDFLKLFMPISRLTATDIDRYKYSLSWTGSKTFANFALLPGGSIINGDALFATGHYIAPFTGKYKVHATSEFIWIYYPAFFIYINGVSNSTMTMNEVDPESSASYEGSFDAVAGDDITIHTSGNTLYGYTIAITDIEGAVSAYGSPLLPAMNLPELAQTDFIKMVCNLFGLIPDVNARDRKINFFNYSELYNNVNIARDWSDYLSERDDETEFKFGDYAQNNYLRYKDSDDVIKDNGRGVMQVNDDTLPTKKDALNLPVSTCDEVDILTDVRVSRIAFNKYETDSYKQEKSIDPRIVYITSTPDTKTLVIRDSISGGTTSSITAPLKASSSEIAMSAMVINYAGLSRMLTKTNLRRAKFNLPVYEVAGFRYHIPIYLAQYKAYFYVNKINNYVPGKLCTIDLIKL